MIRQIDFDSYPFEQWQEIEPFVLGMLACAWGLPFQTPWRAAADRPLVLWLPSIYSTSASMFPMR